MMRWHRSQVLKSISIAIRTDFCQPRKTKKKCGIDQILTSACCPQQNEHVDIKKVACNHVTAILERCHKAKNISLFFLLLLFVKLFISTWFPGTVADTDIITLLEPLWTTDMSFGGHKTETKDLGGIFLPQNRFLTVVPPPSEWK